MKVDWFQAKDQYLACTTGIRGLIHPPTHCLISPCPIQHALCLPPTVIACLHQWASARPPIHPSIIWNKPFAMAIRPCHANSWCCICDGHEVLLWWQDIYSVLVNAGSVWAMYHFYKTGYKNIHIIQDSWYIFNPLSNYNKTPNHVNFLILDQGFRNVGLGAGSVIWEKPSTLWAEFPFCLCGTCIFRRSGLWNALGSRFCMGVLLQSLLGHYATGHDCPEHLGAQMEKHVATSL